MGLIVRQAQCIDQDVGSLTVGKKADIVARMYEPHMKMLYMHRMEQDTGLDRATLSGPRQPKG